MNNQLMSIKLNEPRPTLMAGVVFLIQFPIFSLIPYSKMNQIAKIGTIFTSDSGT